MQDVKYNMRGDNMKALKQFLVRILIKIITIFSVCVIAYFTLLLAHLIADIF